MNRPAPDGRLRVAVDASALRTGRTGIGRYVEQLLRALPAAGIEPMPFSNRPVVGHPTASVRGLRPTAAWLALRARNQAAELLPDLVHYPTGRAPRGSGVPMVITVHDLSPLLVGSGLPRRERWLTAPGLRRGVLAASALIAVSADTARTLSAMFPAVAARLQVIPEGPTLSPADPAESAETLRRRLDLPLRSPVWLHVGAVEPRKRLPALVAAHAEAIHALRQAGCCEADLPTLVLAGPEGSDSARLREAVTRRSLSHWVRITGFLPRSALSGLYRLAELAIAVSLHEGFGLTLLDAMGFGLPALSSGRGALGELADAESALILERAQPAEIAAGLLRLHGDAPLRRALGAAARRRAAAYTWAATATATADLYREVAVKARR